MEDQGPTVAGETMLWFPDQLDTDDDPELWKAALNRILVEVEKKPDVLVEVGRCSHWLRPHQSTWTADGAPRLPVMAAGQAVTASGRLRSQPRRLPRHATYAGRSVVSLSLTACWAWVPGHPKRRRSPTDRQVSGLPPTVARHHLIA